MSEMPVSSSSSASSTSNVSWCWALLAADGAPRTDGPAMSSGFPSQADAETWIGESWRSLLAEGVEQVTLLEGDRIVYGPMSLRP